MPASFTEQLKVATPPDAATGFELQLSVAPDDPPVSESLIELLAEPSTSPEASSTDTLAVKRVATPGARRWLCRE